MCIDRDVLVNTARSGGAMIMDTPVSPVFPDLVKSHIAFPALDVDGANKLLEDAGMWIPTTTASVKRTAMTWPSR
jgi:ABC-type transport system substrate-binding protein